jgi:TatD DNase family protein
VTHLVGSEAAFTDSHCHLQYIEEAAERQEVIDRAVAAGVTQMICVGTDEATSRAALEIAEGCSTAKVYATAGLHPHDASAGLEGLAAFLGERADSPRLVAVGECGLDYHYDHSPRVEQRQIFSGQVGLANEHGLCLVIHTREAFEDTLAILESEGVPERTVFHCFTGGPADAERCLATGGYLSFSGIVTFKNADDVREAVRICPPERLLIETDAPYLAPVPYRGRQNEPALVVRVGEQLAAEKEMSLAEIAALTSANAVRAFGLS